MRLGGLNDRCVHLSPRAGRGRIALAIRVRGRPRRQRGGYDLQHASHIGQHIVVPESENLVVVIGKPLVSEHIARVVGMLPPIDLNNNATLPANQIDRVGTNRFLPNKFEAVEPASAKTVPQSRFGIGSISPQASGALGLDFIRFPHLETPPHPDCCAIRPLPARGERLASGAV